MHREVLGPRWSKNHVAFWIRDAFIAAVLLMSAARIGVWFMSLMPGDVAPAPLAVPTPIVHPPYLSDGLTPTTIAPW